MQSLFNSHNNARYTDPSSNIFLGTINSLWSNAQNWSKNRVPISTDRARIKRNCTLDVTNAICIEIMVDSTYLLNFSTSGNLTFGAIVNNGAINCTSTGSILTCTGNNTTNKIWGTINFASVGTMRFYTASGTLTIPVLDYYNVSCDSGGGTRNINSTTTVRGVLNASAGYLYVNSTSLTVNGNIIWGSNYPALQILNSTLTFFGSSIVYNSDAVYFANSTIYANGVLAFRGFSGGNFFGGTNTVYLRAGMTMSGGNAATSLGNGNTSFICQNNNQTIQALNCNFANLTVEGNITVTLASGVNLVTPIINGTTSLSKLDNRGSIIYTGSVAPMSTGILECSTTANTFSYLLNGSQSIRGINYRNLTLGGTATPNNKTLQGNVSVLGTYSVTGNAVKVDNGFTFGNP